MLNIRLSKIKVKRIFKRLNTWIFKYFFLDPDRIFKVNSIFTGWHRIQNRPISTNLEKYFFLTPYKGSSNLSEFQKTTKNFVLVDIILRLTVVICEKQYLRIVSIIASSIVSKSTLLDTKAISMAFLYTNN